MYLEISLNSFKYYNVEQGRGSCDGVNSAVVQTHFKIHAHIYIMYIIESVDSISRDERGFPLTQYITNGRISRAG